MTPVKDLLKPGMLRAGGVAAALALSVSGGAYAAVQAAAPGGDAEALPETAVVASAASGDIAADADAADVLVAGGDATEVSSVSEDEVDEFKRVEQETNALPEGETEVQTAGVNGVTRVVYQVTSVDGQETSREVISRVVVSERVDEVVLVGTGSTTEDTAEAADASAAASDSASSSGSTASSSSSSTSGSASAADDSVWAALAQCESGGNAATNTGNGFYGLYQFSLSTWQALGGTGYPHEADAATQTAMAKKLQAQSGWGQWPHCAAQLGLL
ncbi:MULTISPECIES: resuscitation-promoting factor [unclassified Actinomyces]|uniref:resuscitation-promoting factor n=1 Tax=unclassified Actinomyces TaxID=2609248 RepID=UPI000D59FEA2|nr:MULTISPECIES: resuscitation-promoting factor [unclassified Actinomyces]RAX24455.1 resuscitation-promoting factor [Actinomyces sp. Z3]